MAWRLLNFLKVFWISVFTTLQPVAYALDKVLFKWALFYIVNWYIICRHWSIVPDWFGTDNGHTRVRLQTTLLQLSVTCSVCCICNCWRHWWRWVGEWTTTRGFQTQCRHCQPSSCFHGSIQLHLVYYWEQRSFSSSLFKVSEQLSKKIIRRNVAPPFLRPFYQITNIILSVALYT